MTNYQDEAAKASIHHANVIRRLLLEQILDGLRTVMEPEDTVASVIEALEGALEEYRKAGA